MTLFGTAEVDCLLRDGERPACLSRGDNDREDSVRTARSEPREVGMLLDSFGRPKTVPPG